MRDPKAMAQTLRQDLAARAVKISHSESLELVSHMFGVADWNTLSAPSRTQSGRPDPAIASAEVYPAIPIRDGVMLPALQLPLWLKRDKTLAALEAAFKAKREVVLVTQRDAGMDDPGEDDVYRVGALARVLDIGLPREEAISLRPEIAGTTEVLVQPFRRVRLLSFTSSGGAWRARVHAPDEGPIASAPELIQGAAQIFEKVATDKGIGLPENWRGKLRLGDPGWFADLFAVAARLSVAQKQELLETFDPVVRLQRLIAMFEAA